MTAEQKDGSVVVHVRDEGVGISDEDRQKLFGEFERVGDPGLAPGTGLGLWLTAALVKAHGGNIWVESKVNEGSVFSFSIPQHTGLPGDE